MGLNRLLKKNGKIPLKWEQTLNRSLGCPDWQDAFYQEIQTLDLFGDTTTTLVKQANTAKFEGFLIERWRTIVSVLARGGNSAMSARRAECPIRWSPARA